MRGILIILAMIVVTPVRALAMSTQASSCVVTIVNERLNGERIRMQFSNELKSKEQCRALAKMHMENFEPMTVKKKTVSFQWHQVKKTLTGLKRLSHGKTKRTTRKYR